MSEITIDLSAPLGGMQVKKNELLQQDANEQIDVLLASMQAFVKVKTNDEGSQKLVLQRCNNTIFIHGERGAGKTTFLNSLLDRYTSDESESKLNILALPLLDPTLVSTRQHILIDIIAKFSDLVKGKLNSCCDAEKFELFRARLEGLAEGLQLLSGKEPSSQYDPSWFLNKALTKSNSGVDLERGIHSLIDTMSNILGSELFLIAIDDVDTDTKKADEVLEVIRRYLTHPRLVVLLTGDLKLYSHIVRNAKYKELKAPGNDDHTTSSLVDHLEQQYLAKVLPIEQRVNLKPLTEVTNSHTVKIAYTSPSISLETTEIKEFAKTVFSNALNIPEKHLDSHLKFLMGLPVRSVLQLLKTMIESNVDNDKKPRYLSSTLKSALYHSFVGSLINQKLELEGLNQPIPDCYSIGYEMFKLLHAHGELETGFYARPDSNYAKSDYNAAKLYLSACVASQFNNENTSSVGEGIKTLLTCGASANVFINFVTEKLSRKASFQEYVDYIGLNRIENITSFAAHLSPLLIPDEQGRKAVASGVIRTIRAKSDNFREDDFLSIISPNKRIPKLDSLVTQHGSFEKLSDFVAAKTVLVSAHRAQTATEGRDYISAYRLLAAISELLTNSESDIEKLSSIPTYAYPSFFDKGTKGDSYNIDEISNDEKVGSQSPHSDQLKNMIENWVNQNATGAKLSSLLLGKIWTRLHYSLNQVSESARHKVKYDGQTSGDIVLGTLLARCVWALINSALIEEWRYGFDNNPQNINALGMAKNIETSPRELIKNLNDLLDSGVEMVKLPFTKALITCPLLWPFLADGELQQTITKVIPKNVAESFKSLTEIDKPEKLQISALPIVGFFV